MPGVHDEGAPRGALVHVSLTVGRQLAGAASGAAAGDVFEL